MDKVTISSHAPRMRGQRGGVLNGLGRWAGAHLDSSE